ncbi:MAG: hypothetical protein KDJ38_08135 [Gammaproteobacteria bacterium]|nr:hypothetical protein [Gammaproteobacteria bacterium]
MNKFMFIYRGSTEAPEMSPEEMQADMEAWIGWVQAAMQAGWMINGGEALLPDNAAVVRQKDVTDGPLIESKEVVGGFSIIQAEDLKAAIELSRGCPAIPQGGSVEIRALMDIPEAD